MSVERSETETLRPSHFDTDAGGETFEGVRMRERLRRRMFERESGLQLGRYELGELLGRGGMGAVYAAHDPELDRRVAIKVLLGAPDDGSARSLRREAQALAALSHPNVVPVYEIGESGGRWFVVMELVDGEPLDRWLGRMPESTVDRFRDVLDGLLQAGRGIAAAHAAGIVHRDVKPGNVLVGHDRVRVADFGLALASERKHPTWPRAGVEDSTALGKVVGTPAYMAPEQLAGMRVDAAADQFSFCVMAFEAIYGWRPHGERPLAWLVAGEPLRPGARRRGVPRAVERVLLRGLAIDPAARHPGMDALLDALARAGSRSGRRWIVASVAAAGLAGLVLARSTDTIQPDDPCVMRSPMSSWWSTVASRGLAGSFDAAAVHDARAMASRVDTAIALYAHRFDASWQRICDSTTGAQRQLRLGCLEERREAVDVLHEAFTAADADVVQGSLHAVHELPDPEPCVRFEPGADLRLPEQDERRRAMRRALTIAETEERLDRIYLIVAWAVAVEAEAALSGHTDLQAQALVQLGWQVGWGRNAVDVLERAWTVAEATGDDRTAAQAAIGLCMAVATTPEMAASEERWVGHAESALHRLDDDPELWAGYWYVRGEIALERSDFVVALDHFRRSLAAFDRVPDHSHFDRAVTLRGMGMATAGLGQHLAAIEYDRAALTLLEHTASSDHRSWGQTAMKLATRLARLGVGRPADELFARGVDVVRSSPSADARALASAYVDFAGLLLFQARYEEAIAALTEALALLESSGIREETIVATAASTLAHAMRFAGDRDGAVLWYRRTLDLLERLPEAPTLRARVVSGLARVEIEAGRPQAALELLESTTVGSDLPSDGYDAGNLRLVEAQAHVDLGRWRDAERAAGVAKLVFERSVAPRSDHMGALQFTLARIAEGRGRTAAALHHYEAAAAIFAEALPYMRPRLADTHLRLAELRWAAGQRSQARADAVRAVEIWQRWRPDDARLAEAEQWLAEHDS